MVGPGQGDCAGVVILWCIWARSRIIRASLRQDDVLHLYLDNCVRVTWKWAHFLPQEGLSRFFDAKVRRLPHPEHVRGIEGFPNRSIVQAGVGGLLGKLWH